MKTLRLPILVPVAVVFAFAACDSANEGALGPADFPAAQASVAGDNMPDLEEFEVCKFGPTATFDYTIDDLKPENNDESGSFTLNDGECYVVTISGGLGEFVTVTERAATGISLDNIVITTIGTGTGAAADVPSRTASGKVAGKPGGGPGGVLAEFFNSRTPTGEGCTPGYWKQPHHFDSWPAPYTPGTQFSSIFDNAYPGKTLLQVLKLKGNKTGLEALGRHTVAALLNSASVGYMYSTAEVISAFNGVYPGSKQEYNAVKGDFADANEAMCPLN